MKLYTIEQLQESYNKGHMDGRLNNIDYSITDGFKPIELPSDEEIEIMSYKYAVMHEDISDKVGKYIIKVSCLDGAKWMRQQILNQNK